MAGTIVVGIGVTADLRTVDFAWLVGELRARVNDANRAVLTAVLTSHDEHGMDMLVADELDSEGLQQFSCELDNVAAALRLSDGESGLVRFLDGVHALIRADPRATAVRPFPASSSPPLRGERGQCTVINLPEFPTVSQMLQTCFNAEDGLSEEQSIRLYLRAVADGHHRETLEAELKAAFLEPETSWRRLLCNDDYEVVDLKSEDDAREHAHRILWAPLLGTS